MFNVGFAGCGLHPPGVARLRRRIVGDLAQFLQPLDLAPEQRAELLRTYLAATKVKRFTFEQLSAAVEKALARRLARKKAK